VRVAVCTVATRSYFAKARSLLASVAEFEPGYDRFAFAVDDVGGIETLAEGTILRPVDVYASEVYDALVRGYDITELATAIKPAVLRHLLDRGYDRVIYLDSDIQVFAPLSPVIDPLEFNDIVLTPHIADAAPIGGRLRAELAIARTGVFNLGFIAIANTANARAMLDWWDARLAEFCRNDVQSGLFVDQRWIDLVPGIFERTHIVRHRGCNVAYWNLPARTLAGDDELRLLTGEPLVFFHFSGFDPRRPDRLCGQRTSIRLSEHPRLQALLESYAARLIAYGDLERAQIPYAFSLPFKARLRTLGRWLFRQRVRWRYRTGPGPSRRTAQPPHDRSGAVGQVR
jgi:hypothetical protein